ncbi:MAG: gamma-glutamylcyclotransferase [Bauldia litoralis]
MPLRVFGYGSLMWRPGFEPAAQAPALLRGHHRAFCVRTVHHRGTADRPGLVLGLAPGGTCHGMLFTVRASDEVAVRAYLHERELRWYPVYGEATVTVEPAEGSGDGGSGDGGSGPVEALTFLPDTRHPDFLGALGDDEIVAIIRDAHGVSGANADYLRETVAHLAAMGIEEPDLVRLLGRLEQNPA